MPRRPLQTLFDTSSGDRQRAGGTSSSSSSSAYASSATSLGEKRNYSSSSNNSNTVEENNHNSYNIMDDDNNVHSNRLVQQLQPQSSLHLLRRRTTELGRRPLNNDTINTMVTTPITTTMPSDLQSHWRLSPAIRARSASSLALPNAYHTEADACYPFTARSRLRRAGEENSVVLTTTPTSTPRPSSQGLRECGARYRLNHSNNSSCINDDESASITQHATALLPPRRRGFGIDTGGGVRRIATFPIGSSGSVQSNRNNSGTSTSNSTTTTSTSSNQQQWQHERQQQEPLQQLRQRRQVEQSGERESYRDEDVDDDAIGDNDEDSLDCLMHCVTGSEPFSGLRDHRHRPSSASSMSSSSTALSSSLFSSTPISSNASLLTSSSPSIEPLHRDDDDDAYCADDDNRHVTTHAGESAITSEISATSTAVASVSATLTSSSSPITIATSGRLVPTSSLTSSSSSSSSPSSSSAAAVAELTATAPTSRRLTWMTATTPAITTTINSVDSSSYTSSRPPSRSFSSPDVMRPSSLLRSASPRLSTSSPFSSSTTSTSASSTPFASGGRTTTTFTTTTTTSSLSSSQASSPRSLSSVTSSLIVSAAEVDERVSQLRQARASSRHLMLAIDDIDDERERLLREIAGLQAQQNDSLRTLLVLRLEQFWVRHQQMTTLMDIIEEFSQGVGTTEGLPNDVRLSLNRISLDLLQTLQGLLRVAGGGLSEGQTAAALVALRGLTLNLGIEEQPPSRGASEECISNLPEQVVGEGEGEEGAAAGGGEGPAAADDDGAFNDGLIQKTTSLCGQECAICLAEYVTKERVRLLPSCGHNFHSRCVDRWLSVNASCPTCRSQLQIQVEA